MVGKVVVTYKRKRLFSGSDQSHLNSHSHASSKNLESKNSGFDQHKNSIAEARFPDLSKELEVFHEDIDDGEEQHVMAVERCDSQQCPEQATKAQSERESHCPNMLLEGNTEENKCTSSSSSLTLKAGDNLHKEDHCSNFRDDPSYKRRLMSPLLTFSRRSKRKRESCKPDDTYKLVTSDKATSVAAHVIPDCQVVISYVEGDVNKSDIISVTNRALVATALHAFDCNQPPESCSDQNILLVDMDFCHKALDSSSEVKEDFPSLQQQDSANCSSTRSAVDKGKSEDSPATCLQLFPSRRSNDMLQTTSDAQKLPSHAVSKQSLLFPDLSLQSNDHALKLSSSYWQHEAPVRQYRGSLQDCLQYTSDQSRQKMMLDNMFTIPRIAMGLTSSSFLDQFLHPYSTWLEDELDCLWIGVRRHGVGNWEAMLRDRRLRFFPWRTIADLAERWREEQSRLVYGLSLDRVNHMIHSQTRSQVDDSQLSLGNSYSRPNFMDARKNRRLQMPVSNPGTSFPYNYTGKEIQPCVFNPYDPSKAGPVKEGLPHWLREAIETPPRHNDPNQRVFSSTSHGKQPIFNINFRSTVPYLQHSIRP